MARALISACLLAALSAVALADRLTLSDGRTFTGTVTTDGDTVRIETNHGLLEFPKDQVSDITRGETPEAELARRLAKATADCPQALLEVAQWAGANNLPHQAEDLYGRILKLDPNNAPSRKALGFIKIDGDWRTFAQALELANSKCQAGQCEVLLSEIMPALDDLAGTKEKQAAVHDLWGQAQLRARKFADAAKTFADLADMNLGPQCLRWGSIAEILKDNPDGMYVVAESYPATSDLLVAEAPALKPGPASLSDPAVIEAALHDRAKKEVETGRKLMDDAQKLETAEPDAAKAKYALAAKSLDKADALAPGISRSYRIEIVRRRIAHMRKETDADASDFDKELASLGKKSLSPQEYRNKVLRLIYLLDNVRDDLKEVLALAKPFSRDLMLEVKWAELDLKKLDEMRLVLSGELDAKK